MIYQAASRPVSIQALTHLPSTISLQMAPRLRWLWVDLLNWTFSTAKDFAKKMKRSHQPLPCQAELLRALEKHVKDELRALAERYVSPTCCACCVCKQASSLLRVLQAF